MLVVIPVCTKDEQLVLKNLEWVEELDGKIDAECVIVHPEGFDVVPVRDKARQIFRQTFVVAYSEWGGDPKWPHPQNWAWQSTARAMATYSPQSWIWWEADATPIRKGWLDAISTEYKAAKKPFMGCLMDGEGSDGHMNGVAVYPADVSAYSTNAMLCRRAPFDIVLWPDIAPHTHKANHLIQNHVITDGDSTHFPDREAVAEIVRPGAVLFHRCKDGSLIDQLRCPRSSGRKALWFTLKPKPAKKGWPSILKQTKWEAGFFKLPSHDSECHFNCTIIEQQSQLWLISRRWKRPPSHRFEGKAIWQVWKSDLVRHKLANDLSIKESYPIVLPKQCGPLEQHEDPRIINRGHGFALGYCSWLMGAEKWQAHQAIASLDSSWNCVGTFHLLYGKNGPSTGAGTGHEKNWIWFYHDNVLHLDYQFSPHIVLKVSNETSFIEFKTQTPLATKWQHGEIRGGAPPVRIGDEYISFFHSSMPWKARQRRYFMGAYAFEAKPPFAVTRITPKPLLAGSEDDPRSLGGPLCVFPVGNVLKYNEWTVTMGVNDQMCAWIKIPHSGLNKLLHS